MKTKIVVEITGNNTTDLDLLEDETRDLISDVLHVGEEGSFAKSIKVNRKPEEPCKYCGNEPECISDSDTMQLRIFKGYYENTIDDEYTGESSIPIKYCPMCGRKLVEDRDDKI